jgi:hypothetical protein
MTIDGTVIDAEAVSEDGGEQDASPRRSRLPRSWPTLLIGALVLAPVAAVCASLIGRHYLPGGDEALELLRIEDVGTRHTPLLGAYSRWGWAHPGPALFWALAPFYRLLGATGVPIGMGILNGLAIAGVIVVAHRRGGYELAALAGLMMALLVRAFGLSLLVDIWNPWAAFLPFVLFVMLAWSAICRDWVMLPLAVFVGSFVVQAHAGYLPVVGPLLGIALAFAIYDVCRRGITTEQRERALRRLIVTGGVALVMWIPALVQQIFSNDGNLAALLSYIRHPSDAVVGWTAAYGILGAQLRPVAPWVSASDANVGFAASSAVWPGAVMLLVVIATGLLALWRGQRDPARLSAVVVILVCSAVLGTAKLTGLPYTYVTRWWWAVAALANLAIVWAVVRAIGVRTLSRVVTGVAVVAILAVGAMSASDLPASFAQSDMIAAVKALDGPTASALDHRTKYLVEHFDVSRFSFVSLGLFQTLADQGFQVFTTPDPLAGIQYGNWRLATPDRVDAILSVVDNAEPGWQPQPGRRLLASYDPLSPEERARAAQLDSKIRADMGAKAPPQRVFVDNGPLAALAVLSGAAPSDVNELAALQRRGDGFAVYLSPAP